MQKYVGDIAVYEFFQEKFSKTIEISRNLLTSNGVQPIYFWYFRGFR